MLNATCSQSYLEFVAMPGRLLVSTVSTIRQPPRRRKKAAPF